MIQVYKLSRALSLVITLNLAQHVSAASPLIGSSRAPNSRQLILN